MRRLYSVLIRCAAPVAMAIVLWRGFRDRGYWQGLGERFGGGPVLVGGPALLGGTAAGGTAAAGSQVRSIWLHAVSLGEMTAAAPLVRALRAAYPSIPLTLTTSTPTGRARARTLFGDRVDVRFFPYDTPGAAARFLERIRPCLGIIMETELWPNVFDQCARRGVPLLLVNARLSAKSMARYTRFGSIFRGLFTPGVSIAAQTHEDAERFVAIGAAAAQVHVAGNIKFDLELSAGLAAKGRELKAAYGAARPTWIAGSTHEGEEEMVLEAHEQQRAAHGRLPATVPGSEPPAARRQPALLLLAPRHPARFESVAQLLTRRGFAFARRSDAARGGGVRDGDVPTGSVTGSVMGSVLGSELSVLLVDTVGELAALYAAADVAFVGGSLVPIGGHNLLEPASLGLPVLTGPYNSNAKDIAQLLLRQGAAVQVNDACELAQAVSRLLADPTERARIGALGLRLVEANRGTVARVLELIAPLLADSAAWVPPDPAEPAPSPQAAAPAARR